MTQLSPSCCGMWQLCILDASLPYIAFASNPSSLQKSFAQVLGPDNVTIVCQFCFWIIFIRAWSVPISSRTGPSLVLCPPVFFCTMLIQTLLLFLRLRVMQIIRLIMVSVTRFYLELLIIPSCRPGQTSSVILSWQWLCIIIQKIKGGLFRYKDKPKCIIWKDNLV